MDAIWIILITLVATAGVSFGLPWLLGLIFKDKDITPYLDWVFLAAAFMVDKFDFIEKALVLKVMNFVKEAFDVAEEAESFATFEEKMDFIIDKTKEIAAREGYPMDQYPLLEEVIREAVLLLTSYMSKKDSNIVEVDFTQLLV